MLKTPNSPQDFTPNSTTKANQRQALLKYMQANGGQVSTIEARENLGISHPAARIMEVRRQGFKIQTRRVLEADASGRLHGVALYVLKGGAA
jgi:hypothetical protein